jgi:RNA polymerase sigma-70 factor (ECF subfamily)
VIPLDDAMAAAPPLDFNLLALDRALEALAVVDERKARVVEMRFFGGLTVDETAVALQVSADTVKRDWRLAKMWLLEQLDGDRGE